MKDEIILCVHRGHNASCAIMQNGQILAVGQEERFSRIKNDIGYPKHSIDYCLKETKINPDNISKIAYTTLRVFQVFLQKQNIE